MPLEHLETTMRQARRRPIWDAAGGVAVDLAGRDIERLIPHRAPFLFVDRLHRVDLEGRRLAGTRRVAADDPVFAGHFPGAPVYPGVLQLEMMGQYILCLLALMRLGTPAPPADARPPAIRALKIHQAVFATEVRPGDDLTVLADIVETGGYTATTTGQVLRGRDVCSAGVMEVYFVD